MLDGLSVNVALLHQAGRSSPDRWSRRERPARGVVFDNTSGYHGNPSTKGLTPGSYTLRVRFDSPIGDMLLGLDLK